MNGSEDATCRLAVAVAVSAVRVRVTGPEDAVASSESLAVTALTVSPRGVRETSALFTESCAETVPLVSTSSPLAGRGSAEPAGVI
jgi:hypothetical protein